MVTSSVLNRFVSALLLGALLVPPSACGGSSVDDEPNGSGGTGGSNGVTLGECDNPITHASGWVSCDDAFSHRESAGTCESSVPRSGEYGGCNDSDCADLPYGHCWYPSYHPGVTAVCTPGCVSDADCAANEVCFCEEPVGRCIPSDCTVDADCGEDAFCSTYKGPDVPACGFYTAGAACQKKTDACVGDECNCALVNGARACVQGLGGCSGG
jgi:hypothetical protein